MPPPPLIAPIPPKVLPALVPLTLIVVAVAARALVPAAVTPARPNAATRAVATMMGKARVCNARRKTAIEPPFSRATSLLLFGSVPIWTQGRWLVKLGRKAGVKPTAISAAHDRCMTAIELAAAGGIVCAAGLALAAGLKVRRRAPIVSWQAWAEAFPFRVVSWGLGIAVTVAVIAGAAAAIDVRVAAKAHRPHPAGGNYIALPQRMALPPRPASSPGRHHRRKRTGSGLPVAMSPSPMLYPSPSLPVPRTHSPAPSAPATANPSPRPGHTATPAPSRKPSPSPSQSPTPSPSQSPSPSPSPSQSPSPSPSPSETPTPSPSPTGYASPTATATSSAYGVRR